MEKLCYKILKDTGCCLGSLCFLRCYSTAVFAFLLIIKCKKRYS